METIITKRVKAKNMSAVFDADSSIRHFKTKNLDSLNFDENNFYTYEINVRHNEDEDPKKLFDAALHKVLFEAAEITYVRQNKVHDVFRYLNENGEEHTISFPKAMKVSPQDVFNHIN